MQPRRLGCKGSTADPFKGLAQHQLTTSCIPEPGEAHTPALTSQKHRCTYAQFKHRSYDFKHHFIFSADTVCCRLSNCNTQKARAAHQALVAYLGLTLPCCCRAAAACTACCCCCCWWCACQAGPRSGLLLLPVLNFPDPATAAESFLLSWEVLGRAGGLLWALLLLLATFFPAGDAAAVCAGDSGGAGCMINRPSAPVS